MARFIPKSREITAEPFTGSPPYARGVCVGADGCRGEGKLIGAVDHSKPHVHTGPMTVVVPNPGDWLTPAGEYFDVVTAADMAANYTRIS